jgi:hypothetical protein
MKDFSKYNKDINGTMTKSGITIFRKQLNGIEGKDIKIEDVSTRGIITNSLNDMATDKEDRGLNVELTTAIKKGDYVVYDNDNYIVLSDIDDHYFYKGTRIRKCEQYLKSSIWGSSFIIPCILENSSYGSKGEVANVEQTSDFDSRGVITVQKNKYTDKIYNGMRFIFNHSKNDVYEITKVQSVFGVNGFTNTGYYQLICKYVKYVQEDDFDNNIAFNPRLDIYKNESELPYITGNETIRINSNEIFKINKTSNVVFNLDDDAIKYNYATIVSQNGTSCTIKGLVADKPITIQVRTSGGLFLCDFDSYVVR